MISISMDSHKRKMLYTAGGALFLLLLWQLLSTLGGTGFLLPSPYRVLSAVFQLFAESESWLTVAVSMSGIVLSILVATCAAVLLAWSASRFERLRFLMIPIVQVMKVVPIVSFILIAMFFMSARILTSFISGLVVFPMIYNHLLSAFLNVDRRLLEMARTFSMKKRDVVRYIVIPQAREEFLAASSVAIGMAWKAGVAAEVLAFSKNTIGRRIYDAKLYLDMERLLAWTVVLVMAAFVVEKVLVALYRLALVRIGERLPKSHVGGQSEKAAEVRPSTVLADVASVAQVADRREELIVIGGLCKKFDRTIVFDDFSATLNLDRPVLFVGASGSGKTTLLRLIAGLDEQDCGTISGVPERGLFVFQDNRLLPQLSARDNVRVVLPGYDGDVADRLLRELDLSSVKDQQASTLSGGEQRRLALARALAPESDILYLDEAFRELDEKNETTAIELVRQVAREKPILLASHDHGLVERLNASVVMISKQPHRA